MHFNIILFKHLSVRFPEGSARALAIRCENGGMKTAFVVHTRRYSIDVQPGKISIALEYSLYEGTDLFAAPFSLDIEIIDA